MAEGDYLSKPITELDYNNGSGVLPEGSFRISASSFNMFMTAPHQWFREHVLGEEGFTGSTASVIGTCVHYIAEKYAKGKHPDLMQIEQYIANHSDNENVDCEEVRRQYKMMGEALVNQYISTNRPYRIEEFISHEMYPGIFPSGSCDAVYGSDNDACIVDYKTYNSNTKPKTIPLGYKYQLLIYAYLYGLQGVNITRVRLVYLSRYADTRGISEKTGKPIGKESYPEVTVLTEEITDEDIEFIKSVLSLCAETYIKYKEDPSLAYLLYRDYRLKEQ